MAVVDMFRCTKRSLTLTPLGCARLHESCSRDRPDAWEGRHLCMFCPTGAKNRHELLGGPAVASGSPFEAAEAWRSTCARCRRKTDRLIRAKLCVSCQNREYEVCRGRNAKGTRPALQLRPQTITVAAGATVRRVQQDLATGTTELMIGAIKSAAGPVAFGWGLRHG